MTYYVCLNLEDLKGRTALTLAASRSRTDVIKLLLFHNASVNHAAKNGTALIHATIQHSHKCMEVLLQGGADIECTCVARDGKTPLILGNDNTSRALEEGNRQGFMIKSSYGLYLCT